MVAEALRFSRYRYRRVAPASACADDPVTVTAPSVTADDTGAGRFDSLPSIDDSEVFAGPCSVAVEGSLVNFASTAASVVCVAGSLVILARIAASEVLPVS